MSTHLKSYSPGSPSLLWYDFETWGANPQKDMPCQFAAIRTDFEFNPIAEPLNFYCQIASDCLPHPEAVLVTGITPQQSLRDGLIEAEFVKNIHAEFSQPNTCVLGYNNLRFDDEVTRYAFYRNFYDPYAREWQNGSSRWDIIDMARACYALRPEGINWPEKDDGSPSFKLESLSNANNLMHEAAHDALSDVYATIGLAKLIKQQQPRLYNYLFELRNKNKVATQLDYHNATPLVHVSSKLPANQGCTTWIVPLSPHPKNKNAVICLNLQLDPTPLFELDIEQLRSKLYQPTSELAEGEQRLPIKLLHLNKCPVIAPAKTLTSENAERLTIDRQQCLQNLQKIKAFKGLTQKLVSIFESDEDFRENDPDHALYDGFVPDDDKRKMSQIHQSSPEQLGTLDWQFKDPRLNKLLFRYRARNYPSSLTDGEIQRWQTHRKQRFLEPDSVAGINLDNYLQKLEVLSQTYQYSKDKMPLLRALYQYAENL